MVTSTVQATKPYKALVYILGAVGALVASLATDGITRPEVGQILVAVAGALVIWLTTNLPSMPRLKEVSALVMTATNVLVAYITGGMITQAEWINLVLVALGLIGVVLIPNPPIPGVVLARKDEPYPPQ